MRRTYAAIIALVFFSASHATKLRAEEPAIPALPIPVLVADAPFTMEDGLKPRVQFWVDIYTKYNSWELVVHNDKYPEIIYTVIDTRVEKHAFAKAKGHILKVLTGLAAKANKSANLELDKKKLTKEECRIFDLFAGVAGTNKFADAADPKHIHGQSGLRDTLKNTLFVSGRYLPRMLNVFEGFGLPSDLAYLPFVESGFNKNAISRAGASGIWQFMPYTGKVYLREDEVVDERNDPMRSAEAAARLLKQNFDQLKDWALAITAYNHGATGIANAAKETGSTSLVEIIKKYNGKNFGFASENYYSCFLASLHVAKHAEFYLGKIERAKKLEFDEFVMPDFIDATSFVAALGIKMEDFRDLNPALSELVYSGERYIPVGYTVRVPVTARTDFMAKYEQIPEALKHEEQKIDLPKGPEELTLAR